MLIYNIPISQTAVIGVWSFNTKDITNGLLRLIVVKANTATTTFFLTITDSQSDIIYYNETPATGTLREQVAIPIKGINTIAVSSASVDEAFTGKLSIVERGM